MDLHGLEKRKAKQRWVIEKPKLENIEPHDEEFKLTMKAAQRNSNNAL